MTTLNRQPLQIVEIDIDYCANTYGSAPCTASLGGANVRKCYNTYFTCQDTANFTTGTLTLRFGENQSGLPQSTLIYPALAGPVRTNPTKINLGGVGDRIGSLGKRARVQVSLQDFTDSDIYTDKYRSGRIDATAQNDEGGYDPAARGTFFTKLRRRFPYYNGRALRVLEGYVGDSLGSMRTRNYVITEWKGPDAGGRVTITASDILVLADNKKSLCPVPSRGKIDADISNSYTGTVNLLPATVGAEYATSGRASLGSEIVSYTRASDTVTLTGRGLDGSEASSHSENDLFQEAYRVNGVTVDLVAQELLEDYAGVATGFIPIADWTAEATRWIGGVTLATTIAKPTGVAKLLGELAQLGVFWWWDDVAQEIKMRVNRPLDTPNGETAAALSDDATIIEGSIKPEDMDEKRVSRVLFWHGQLDKAGDEKSGENFGRLFVALDADAEGANEYDETKVFEIFFRWLGLGDDSTAAMVATRLLNRYRDTTREVTFAIDVKDEAAARPADLIELTTRVLTDDTGNSLPTAMQITAVEEDQPGHRLMVTAQTYEFRNRYGFITENTRPVYASSTAADILKGTYIVGATGTFGDGTGPYRIF